MAIKTLAEIKAYFETGDIPTQAQFIDTIDTLISLNLAISTNGIIEVNSEISTGAVGIKFGNSLDLTGVIKLINLAGSGPLALEVNNNGTIVGTPILEFCAFISQTAPNTIPTLGINGSGAIIKNTLQVAPPTIAQDGGLTYTFDFPDMVADFDIEKTRLVLDPFPVTGENFGGIYPYFTLSVAAKKLTLICWAGDGYIINQFLKIKVYP